MKCPICEEEDLKSMVHILYHGKTCMGHVQYFDENGAYHNHDPNLTTTKYSCTNGHSFNHTHKNKCWCGYGE